MQNSRALFENYCPQTAPVTEPPRQKTAMDLCRKQDIGSSKSQMLWKARGIQTIPPSKRKLPYHYPLKCSVLFFYKYAPLYIHHLRTAAYQKSMILPLLITPVLMLLYPAVPDLPIQEQTWMSPQWILFSPLSASCDGIFLCFDAPCAAIPLSH